MVHVVHKLVIMVSQETDREIAIYPDLHWSWGIYWEVTGSSLRATAVADKYDIAAYCAGSILYWMLNAVVARVHMRDESRNT